MHCVGQVSDAIDSLRVRGRSVYYPSSGLVPVLSSFSIVIGLFHDTPIEIFMQYFGFRNNEAKFCGSLLFCMLMVWGAAWFLIALSRVWLSHMLYSSRKQWPSAFYPERCKWVASQQCQSLQNWWETFKFCSTVSQYFATSLGLILLCTA